MSLHPPPPAAADALATAFASGLDGPSGGAWAATRRRVVVWRADGTGDAAEFQLPMPAGGGFVCVLQEVCEREEKGEGERERQGARPRGLPKNQFRIHPSTAPHLRRRLHLPRRRPHLLAAC